MKLLVIILPIIKLKNHQYVIICRLNLNYNNNIYVIKLYVVN